jgi:hypothetical protein
VSLDSTSGLEPHRVEISSATYGGHRAVYVVNQLQANGQAIVLLPHVTLRNGTIDVDVAGRPRVGASPGARGA